MINVIISMYVIGEAKPHKWPISVHHGHGQCNAIRMQKKNKSRIKLNNRSPEQIDDGVSLGIVHLPSSLPNPLHKHLVEVKVRVKMAWMLVIDKMSVIVLDSECTSTQTVSIVIVLNLKSCNISWMKEAGINHHFASQSRNSITFYDSRWSFWPPGFCLSHIPQKAPYGGKLE